MVVLLLCGGSVSAAQTFRFLYEEGEQYRILSTVEQDVWVNGDYSHHATILNRISVEVTRADAGRGYHVARFVTSEEAESGQAAFTWGEEYHSEFWRGPLGHYEIDPAYFMPVVRDVPVFPDRPVLPGDTWSAAGNEVHDFRRSFGIPDAYHFPIPVTYRYEGTAERDGREVALLRVSYNVFYRPTRRYPSAVYPVRITGYSNQLVYWDVAAGRPHEYEEEYAFAILLSSGSDVLFEGVAGARIIEATRMDRLQVADDVRRSLDELGFEDQDVVVDDRGVTIRLDTILFPPDSPLLRDSEKAKLASIAGILSRYPDRDILIAGHTALAGTEPGRQRLSEERAAAVADYLLELGVRERDQMMLRGFGATEPVASNETEEGMRRNRRVEITILEN